MALMDFSLVKHIHIITATLFLLFLLFKSTLLLLNKNDTLKKIKKYILVPDILIQTGFLTSGLALVFMGSSLVNSQPAWFHIKMTAVIIGVILAIIAFKKNSKLLVVVSLFVFVMIYGYTEMIASKHKKGMSSDNIKKTVALTGKLLYSQYCNSCHGDNGKKGLSGAKDLSVSKLSAEESLIVISEGRNNMIAYQNQLSKEQIELVNNYIQGFKQ